jgi:hypothetical protein
VNTATAAPGHSAAEPEPAQDLDVLALCEIWRAVDFPERGDHPADVSADQQEAL